MKLELFEFIDDTLLLLDNNTELLEEVAEDIDSFFNNSFEEDDHFLNTKCRIKSKDSLREKILRRNLYLEYDDPENVLLNLSDLIGLRIECRFIEDELKVYKDVLSLFNVKVDDLYYTNKLNPKIMLNLEDPQPMIQENGFEIYKIDGKYKADNLNINFELQIKSMVNVFWSEIDHRILYKNFNYVLTEDFYRDIMASIKDNLSMIDRQLLVVFNHLNDLDAKEVTNEKVQFKALLSKMIHDVYIGKVRDELGFVIGFKRSTDVIVDYIFVKERENGANKYSDNFIRILNRITDISNKKLNFDEYIRFENKIIFEDEFSKIVGARFLEIINKDFRWNLFFKIIFEIEETDESFEFKSFLDYLRGLYLENLEKIMENKLINKENKTRLKEDVLYCIGKNFTKETDIEFINEKNVQGLNKYISILLNDIDTYDEWLDNKAYICEKIIDYEI